MLSPLDYVIINTLKEVITNDEYVTSRALIPTVNKLTEQYHERKYSRKFGRNSFKHVALFAARYYHRKYESYAPTWYYRFPVTMCEEVAEELESAFYNSLKKRGV